MTHKIDSGKLSDLKTIYNIENLSPGTTYYLRFFCANDSGIQYSKQTAISTIKINIGDTFMYGKVFELDADGRHGKIAALKPVNSGRTCEWGCLDKYYGLTDMNDGYKATRTLWRYCFNPKAISAVYQVYNVDTSWYLPAINELKQFIPLFPETRDKTYWSSTEISKEKALALQNNINLENMKNYTYLIWPCRKF
jgi:hypothetical protein